MKNKQKLTEQQLQEELLDEIGDFTKAITKKIGQGVGAVTGAGQKVKGVAKRSVDALGKSFQQGKQQTQKAVAGQDYKAPAPKAQAQAQPQAQQTKQPGGISTALKKFGKGVAGADSYNYRLGTQAQQDAAANKKTTGQTPAQTGTQAATATTPAGGSTQAQKRTKTGGRVAGKVSNTKSAQYQRDRRAANKAGGSAVSKGIDQAQKDAANQGVANMQKKQAGQTATKVPGQKQPTPTAQNVGKNTGVNTAKIGGQKVDLNDPKMQNLRKAIEKASAGTVSKIDKLDTASKQKLKKAIA